MDLKEAGRRNETAQNGTDARRANEFVVLGVRRRAHSSHARAAERIRKPPKSQQGIPGHTQRQGPMAPGASRCVQGLEEG